MSPVAKKNAKTCAMCGTEPAPFPSPVHQAALRSEHIESDLNKLLTSALRFSGSSCCTRVAVFLLDPGSALLHLAATHPFRPDLRNKKVCVPMDERLLSYPHHHQKMGRRGGEFLDLISPKFLEFGTRSFPIYANAEFIGVLIFEAFDAPDASLGSIEMMNHLSRNIVELINTNAQLEQNQDQRENDFNGISEKTEIHELLYSQTIFSRTDIRGRIIDINDAFCEISGYEKSELIGSNHRIINSDFQGREFWFAFWSTLRSGNTWRGEICNRAKNGDLYWVDSIVAPMRDHNGQKSSYISVCFDITERKKSEEVISRFGRILDGSSDEIYIIDKNTTKYLQANAVACKNVGYSLAELNQMNPVDIVHQRQSTEFESALNRLAAGMTEKVELEARHVRKDGSSYPVEVRLTVADGETLPVYVANVLDVSRQKKAQAEIERLAFTDPLTGLPNRASTLKRLEHLVVASNREESDLSLLFIDLDRFKEINDTRGHQIGDVVLQAVAIRFQNALRTTALLGRVGGDEFVAILPKTDERSAVEVAKSIQELMKDPVDVDGEVFFLGASVGVTSQQPGENSPEALVSRADTAMYNAKAARLGVALYHPEMTLELKRKRNIANWLKEAIKQDELSFAFQPQVDLPSREFTGAEVLLRWKNSPVGEISPSEFIPIAEERGMMPELGEWVFTNLCKLLSGWSKAGWRLPEHFAVNISAAQLTTPDFQKFLSRTLKEYDLPPKLFELEITEHVLMNDALIGLETLKTLKDEGFSVAIDDFGTGCSSLSHVKWFAADKIKIDMSFVQDMHRDDASYAIVSAIVAMADRLGMSVVAEGVEQDKQASTLRSLGCDQAQGFLYSEPLSAETFRDDWMTRNILEFSINA